MNEEVAISVDEDIINLVEDDVKIEKNKAVKEIVVYMFVPE